MARIEQAAQAAFAQDVGAGHAKASSSKSAPPAPPVARKPPQKPSNAFVNYSTAESLGYKDPDADRLIAEAQRRRTQGVAGDWEIVTSSGPASISTVADEEMSRKREADAVHDDDRHFKLRKKTLMTGLGEIYDPGIIPIKPKKKKEERAESDNLASANQSGATAPKSKWTTLAFS
jgi:WW domain-binding protein 4